MPGQTSLAGCAVATGAWCFNGGPDNCPAKRRLDRLLGGSGRLASMEGRTIARPNAAVRPQPAVGEAASMEGRTIARPNASKSITSRRVSASLQWRAGQLPGQTRRADGAGLDRAGASMEGRTIARPNHRHGRPAPGAGHGLQWRAGQLPGQTHPRPGVGDAGAGASMEGRTIARPNRPRLPASPTDCSCFNGGPDNCPAKPAHATTVWRARLLLQWRAGQLPGQTPARTPRLARRQQASMEGRTIARPNPPAPPCATPPDPGFNGGPDNCPAKPPAAATTRRSSRRFNGGPDNCPAKPPGSRPCRAPRRRFNGGPDNCPAKPSTVTMCPSRRPRFNGGPDNCPAKPAGHLPPPQRRVAASMEGRTIARPNHLHERTSR